MEEVLKIVLELHTKAEEYVAIFGEWNYGMNYTLIKDGDGQNPIIKIEREIVFELKEKGFLYENSLSTHKRRTLREFRIDKVKEYFEIKGENNERNN